MERYYLKPLLVSVLAFLWVFGFAQTQLNVTGLQVQTSKIYNASTQARVTSQGTLTGLDDPYDDVRCTATAVYNSADAGSSKTITVTFVLTGDDAGKYLAPVARTMSGEITQKELEIDVDPYIVKRKQYDGNTAAVVREEATLRGVEDEDATNVAVTTSASYNSATVGNKTITARFVISGNKASNYTAPADATYQGQIVALQLTAANTVVQPSKTYDGDTTCVVVSAGTLGTQLVEGDVVTLGATAKYADPNAGYYKQVIVKYTIDGADAANYIVPVNDETTYHADITPKTIVAHSDVTLSKPYDRNRLATATLISTEGIISGDDVTVAYQAAYDNSSVGDEKTITIYYAITGTDARNYNAPLDSIVLHGEITKAQSYVSNTTVDTYKQYDGNDTAEVTSPGTLNGVKAGDNVTVVAEAHYNDSSAGDNKYITITYRLEGPDAGNYEAPASVTQHNGSISPIKLTVGEAATIKPTKVYDGTTDAEVLTHGKPQGVIPGDSVSFFAEAHYINRKAGDGKHVYITYTLEGPSAANYEAPTRTQAVADISRLQLIILPPASVESSKVYDGNTTANVVSIGKLVNLVSGDSVNVRLVALYDSASVGINTRKIFLYYTIYGTDATNYLAPVNDTLSYQSITPRQAIVTGTTVKTIKVYDGTESATVISSGSLSNTGSDDVQVTATAVYEDGNVGVGKRIITTYTLSGSDARNYTEPKADTSYVGVVTKKVLTISQNAKIYGDKEYDGTAECDIFADGEVSGVVPGDVIYLESEAWFYDASIGVAKRVTIDYWLDGSDTANYVLFRPQSDTTASITRRQLYATNTQVVTSKKYDGTTSATVTHPGVLTGQIEGDTALTLYAYAQYDSAVAGTNRIITVSYRVSGPNSGNYFEPQSYTRSGEITNYRTIVSGTTVQASKTYDGTTSITVTNVGQISNKKEGDDVALVVDSAYYSDANVGTGKTVTVIFALTGADRNNYSVPEPVTLFADITSRPLSVNGTTVAPSKKYDGTTTIQVKTNGVLSGAIPGDNISFGVTASYQTPAAGNNKPVDVTYYLTGSSERNYTVPAAATLSASILPDTLSVTGTIINPSKSYDGTATANVVNPGTLVGKIGTDDVSLNTTAVYSGSSIGTGLTISVTYTLAGADAGNYIVFPSGYTLGGGEIVASKPTVTGTQVTQTKTYDATASVVVYNPGTLVGVDPSHDVRLSATAQYSDKNVGNNKAITITFTLSGSDASNYITPDPITVSGSITHCPVTVYGVTIDNNKVYDGTTDANVSSYGYFQGKQAGDSLSLVVDADFIDANAGLSKPVSMTYTLAGPDAGNYILRNTIDSTTSRIARRTLTVTGTSVDLIRTYDGLDTCHIVTNGVLNGLCGNDHLTFTAEAHYNDKNVGVNKPVTVSYQIYGAAVGNYNPAPDTVFTNGIITQATLDVANTQLAVASKVYDGGTSIGVSDAGQLIGKVPTDSVYLTATANFLTPDVDPNKPVEVVYSLGGRDAANYSVPDPQIKYADITCRTLTVMGTTIRNDKVYDGTSNAVIDSIGKLVGVVAGDAVALSATAHYDDYTPGTNRRVQVQYVLHGSDSANYCINDSLLTTVYAITRAQLSPDGVDLNVSRVYDATIDAYVVISPNSLIGKVGTDSVCISARAYYNDKNVGTNKPITILYDIYGPDTAYYIKPADSICAIGAITPAPLSVANMAVDEWKAYDGSTTAVITGTPDIVGVFAGDAVVLTPSADFDDPQVGNGKTITASFVTSGADAANYAQLADLVITNNGRIFEDVELAPSGSSEDPSAQIKIATEQADYCEGDVAYINYNVAKGDPFQYRIQFNNKAKSAGFEDVDWSAVPFDITVNIPDSCSDGEYLAFVQFRNELQERDGTTPQTYDTLRINVRVSNRYIVDIFEDVVSIDNRENRFTSYQWYKNNNILTGANLPYYQDMGGLDGEYYVVVNLGTESERRICSKEFHNRKAASAPAVTAYPNPVVDVVNLSLEGFEEDSHILTVVNASGMPVLTEQFEGNQYSLSMGALPTGNYTLVVDGVSVKTIKK